MSDALGAILIVMYFVGVLLLVLWVERIDQRLKKLEDATTHP